MRYVLLNILNGDMMKENVESVLDKIRLLLKADGGDVELVEVTSGGR